jgi:SRSO17 transposase
MSIDVEVWAAGLDELAVRVGHRFGRVEPRRQAMAYVRGLLAGLERKNGWTLAEFAGDSAPDAMQRLLRRARWDADGLRDDLRTYVVEHLGDSFGVLIVDETGFLKKGVRSAGVQRQYSGTAGRTENCQVGTFLAYASRHGRALIDRELYMPASWIADRDRCRVAGVPQEVEFATKPQQAKAMIARAIAAGVPFRWVTADELYGQAKHLQRWLEELNIFHVLAVKCTDTVTIGEGRAAVKDLVAALPEYAWRRRSAGAGAHGERIYDWTRIPLPAPASGRGRWVLARRRISDGEIAYYVCYGPAATTLNELITTAGTRWMIEECFQAAKNEAGLDHYQVRRYDAWYRHITLSMLAHAYLAATAASCRAPSRTAPSQKGDPPPVDPRRPAAIMRPYRSP